MSDNDSIPAETQSAEYVVIARRYRPQTFEDLVGQEHVARALQQAIASDRVGHAYLFTGARGVGKTSAARILAKALNCVHGPTATPCNACDVCQRVSTGDDVDVLEIDGASNRGIDEIRQLRQNVAVRPSRVRYKIYIIDEVHMLTKEAFNALLKTLEEPPEHVKFIFATTEPQKIPITILSRCQRFDFAGISAAAIQARLQQIANAESVEIEPEAVQIIAARAAGSMRDSQSLLEQLLAVAGSRISSAEVNELLGIAPVQRLAGLVERLVARDAASSLAELDAALREGVEVGQLLDQLIGYFRDTMASAVGCDAEQMLYALPSQVEEIQKTARTLGLSTVLAIIQILDHAAARLRLSMHGRTLMEMAIVRICQLENLDDLAALVAELRTGNFEAHGRNPNEVRGVLAQAAPLKKNDEHAPGALKDLSEGSSLARGFEQRISDRLPPAPEARAPEARAPENGTAASRPLSAASEEAAPSEVSVLRYFQQALSGATPPPAAPVPIPQHRSRREQLAKVADEPFVKRAMELFDVAPDKIRYTPPESDTN